MKAKTEPQRQPEMARPEQAGRQAQMEIQAQPGTPPKTMPSLSLHVLEASAVLEVYEASPVSEVYEEN